MDPFSISVIVISVAFVAFIAGLAANARPTHAARLNYELKMEALKAAQDTYDRINARKAAELEQQRLVFKPPAAPTGYIRGAPVVSPFDQNQLDREAMQAAQERVPRRPKVHYPLAGNDFGGRERRRAESGLDPLTGLVLGVAVSNVLKPAPEAPKAIEDSTPVPNPSAGTDYSAPSYDSGSSSDSSSSSSSCDSGSSGE